MSVQEPTLPRLTWIHIPHEKTFKSSINMPNLEYVVLYKTNGIGQQFSLACSLRYAQNAPWKVTQSIMFYGICFNVKRVQMLPKCCLLNHFAQSVYMGA